MAHGSHQAHRPPVRIPYRRVSHTYHAGAPSPPYAHGKGGGSLRKVALWWPVANLLLIYFLVSRRMLEDVEMPCEASGVPGGSRTQTAAVELTDASAGIGCLNDCSGYGVCVDDECHCLEQFTGDDCSRPQCLRNCSGMGTCLPSGDCLCRGRFVGADCSVSISDLQMDSLQHQVGPPFSNGRLEEDIEVVINTKSRQMYPRALCHSKQCAFTWASTLMNLSPYLPRNDYRPHFKTCAIVSSSKQLVYLNATSKEDMQGLPRRDTGYGEDIDKHYMVMRLDNAPTEGYEKWVGTRTTHRLVQGDYAHMVNNMLGTEQVVGSRKTVVTPSTWWAGGYPAVEKVTYLMSVPGTSMSGGKELRSPEHSGYSAFTEVFPGNRRMLLSPIFLQRAAQVDERVRRTLGAMSLDCIKVSQDNSQARLSALFVALLFSLQSCDQIAVYGVTVGQQGGGGHMPEAVTRIVRDSKFRMHVQGVANKAECCYYPLEEDYTPEVSLCDEITRKYSLRMLKESGRVQFYE
mmetsp:Transcript_5139/g.9344  ORF Transcript_5139/g.9344 Transcript_5139/m.9344 type:complete len:517 (-) Transcript_5139:207-1757(-)